MSATDQSSPLFFGIAERAAYVREGATNLYKWNALGLKHIVLSNIFPTQLPAFHLVVAFPRDAFASNQRFVFVDDRAIELGWANLGGAIEIREVDPSPSADRNVLTVLAPTDGWTLMFLPYTSNSFLVRHPGNVFIHHQTADGPIIGRLTFALVDPPPLSEARVAAIRADPTAAKAVRVSFECSRCASKLNAYAALDRLPKMEEQGYVWYQELPSAHRCDCGNTEFSLATVRRNLHGLLGASTLSFDRASFTPQYEESALAELRARVAKTLAASPGEETLQLLVEQNPVLLHQFAALRIFHKPPILTQFFADFALLTPRRELLLVEIEKTSTRLLKKDGGIAAELSHAFDQVRSWLHVADEHRLAVLDSMDIDRDEVSSIRGVVIAGRDQGYDALHLRRLKGQDWGRIAFFTYDDLLFGLDALVARMKVV